jgi:DNA-nicking Smr family endonuclease
LPKRIPIEDWFDLHSFLPRDIPAVLADYLAEAHQKQLREVRVIHGKGRGTRRAQVRRLLAQHPLVEDFFDAPPERGSFGATIIVLKLSRSSS